MKNRFILFLPAFLWLTFAFGQQGTYLPWEFAGGPPCPINDVVLHNGTLYAATDCGLYKKPESGGVWEQQADTPDSTVLFLAANAGTVVAVFRKDVPWTIFNTGYSTLRFFNSTDQGATFSSRFSSENYNYIAPSGGQYPWHMDPNGLYALGDSTFVLSVYDCPMGCHYAQIASTNNGRTWSRRDLPSYQQPHFLNPYAVQADTVAIFNFDSLQFLHISDLQHLTAIKIPAALTTMGEAAGLSWVDNRITITFQDGHYAYTNNAGQNWTLDSLPFFNINDFFYHENYYYWITNNVFYRSPMAGSVVLDTLYTYSGSLGHIDKIRRGTGGWYIVTNTLLQWLSDGSNEATSMNGPGAAKGTLSYLPNRLMFRNDRGLWWQSPDGETWSVDENETAYQQSFRQYYSADTFSLALTIPPDNWTPQRIYRSIDGGLTWSFSTTSTYFSSSGDIDFLKNQLDGRVYFGQYFTADGGLTWQSLADFTISAARGDTLLTTTSSGYKLSFNHGLHWQDLALAPSGGYKFVLANRTLFALSSYPAEPIYRSDDFGVNWDSIGTSSFFDNQAVWTEQIGQAIWIRGQAALCIIPNVSRQYWRINAPFSSQIRDYPERWAFGRIVLKDSTLYAAYNGGIWRTSSCYTEHPAPSRDTTICQGNIVLFHGDTLRTTGTYTQAISNLNTLCDSLDVLHLQVNLIKTNWYKQICAGDTLLWNNQAYSGNGVFTQLFSTPTSCDSSVTLYLSNYYTIGQSSMAFCAGDVIQAYGDTISAPGHYIFHLTSFLGCDSTLLLHVYDAQDTFIYSPVICAGAEYSLYGHTYTETGEYWFSRTAISSHCPTIYHIFLTVQPDEVIALDTFVTVGTIIYGHTINSDTIFTVLVAGPNSCDKITTITVHTTVGTDNLNAEQAVQAFPNPFRDQLTLRWSAGEIAQVRLYDARGQLWREGQLGGPKAVWNTGDLPTGLYRVEFLFGEQRYNWKVVKVP